MLLENPNVLRSPKPKPNVIINQNPNPRHTKAISLIDGDGNMVSPEDRSAVLNVPFINTGSYSNIIDAYKFLEIPVYEYSPMLPPFRDPRGIV